MFTMKTGMTLLAALFGAVGLFMIADPAPMAVPHPAWKYGGPTTQLVSAQGTRVHGVVALLLGFALLAASRKA